MFSRQSHGKWHGGLNIAIYVFLSSVVERVELLSPNLIVRHLHKTSASMVTTISTSSSRLYMQRTGSEEDADKYAYVHPSIREVLVMEPEIIPIDFFESKGFEVTDDAILANAGNYTIKWNVLEEFIERGNAKMKAPELKDTISMELLVILASQSELGLFRDNELRTLGVPSPIHGLLQIIPDKDYVSEEDGPYFLIATLLALNMVENSIRHLIGKKTGRAPLLKDMIEIMAASEGDDALPKSMISVLRTLLLPKNGINLRNLLWHGFLPTIHRRWFSLSVALTLSLDELAGSSSFKGPCLDGNLETIAAMRQHEALVTILDHGKGILASREKTKMLAEKMMQSNTIPRGHAELCRVALNFINQPIIFASVAGPLIEHLLRIMWCHENNQKKYIAEPGSYYVTLDGHGQRDKHEIVIMPYFSQPQQLEAKGIRNRLVYRLGGPTMAFLMDMFTSPPGAPNIRASVAHGSFNKYLFAELVAIEGKREDMRINIVELEDMTSALISILDVLCDDCQYDTCETDATSIKMNIAFSSYRPCFSYSASLLVEVDNMVDAMKPLYKFIHDGHHLKHFRNSSQSQMQSDMADKMMDMSQSIEAIVGMQESIYEGFGIDKSKFTNECFFRESSNNLSASECGAAKLLLSEISKAASSSHGDLNDGIAGFQGEQTQLSSRRRKQVSRMCAAAKLTLDFYSFAAYCALLYIERRQNAVTVSKNMDSRSVMHENLTDDELFVAVKRSRMVVSTFSTTKTFDRALSALAQYTAGKAVKAISERIQNPSGEN